MKNSELMRRTSSAPGKAVVCMLLGAVFLTANDAVMKWLTDGYSVGQIMACRGFFVFIPLSLLIWRAGGISSLRPIQPVGHFIRAGLVIAGTFMFVTGLRYLTLTDAIAIAFAGPLFITALAAPLLGEKVGWRRWMAVLAGFVGIVVIMQPSGSAMQWAALLPLGASLTGAFRDILTRRLSARETSVALLFYTSLGMTLAGLATAPFVWKAVPLADWGMFALSGMITGCAHFLMIETFRMGEAAMVAPFKYSSVIWAAALGYFVWGDIPDAGTLSGVAIVIFAGLYILHRERGWVLTSSATL